MSVVDDQRHFEISPSLGAVKHEFRVSRGALAMHVFVVVLGSGLLGAAVWKNWQHLIAPKDVSVLILHLALAAAAAGLCWGTAAVVRHIRRRDMRLLLYADGFVCHRAGQTTSCRWDDVDVVHEEIAGGGAGHAPVNYRKLTIRSRAGTTWVFDMRRDLLEQFPRLVGLVEEEVSRRHLPLALYDLRVGRSINCGAVQLTPDGLACGGEVLPWHQVGCVYCFKLDLRIDSTAGHWRTVNGNDVVNLSMLLTVIREKTREAAAT
jgi:hypothetical protein